MILHHVHKALDYNWKKAKRPYLKGHFQQLVSSLGFGTEQ